MSVVAALAAMLGCDANKTSGDDTGIDPTSATTATTDPDSDSGDTGAADDGDGSDGGTSSDDDSTGPTDTPPTAPDGYYVEGNAIFHESGTPHRFLGVARPSLEWNSQGEYLNEGDYQLMASWGANVVRIALNQGFWLQGSIVHDPGYESTVDQQIAWAHAAGMDVILDLHWSDRGNLSSTPDQQRMADPNSVTFWQQVANRYQDDGRVVFELYNEPHDVGWDVWRDGGDSGDGFTAVGMQDLYEAVRGTGAHNLVIVGGLDYAYDLFEVPSFALDGYNIAYATHPYDYGGKGPGDWDADWGFLTDTYPIVVTEFGSFDCNPNYGSQLISYANERGLSWTAWAWYPGGCDFPALIENWAGDPSPSGQVVRTALMNG
jgi:aryl-phospho-beta-D-glucosidase BglC (GH1 family)